MNCDPGERVPGDGRTRRAPRQGPPAEYTSGRVRPRLILLPPTASALRWNASRLNSTFDGSRRDGCTQPMGEIWGVSEKPSEFSSRCSRIRASMVPTSSSCSWASSPIGESSTIVPATRAGELSIEAAGDDGPGMARGPEQRREAPADRSGAERGLAPRPRSRPARGTGGTENERRCGGRWAVAVAVYILHLRESTQRSVSFPVERRLAGGSP